MNVRQDGLGLVSIAYGSILGTLERSLESQTASTCLWTTIAVAFTGNVFHLPMKSLDAYLAEAERVHGHLCAGQILGVRMAIHALEQLGITDPQGADRKRLVTFVEIDRCATDAIGVVTGCRLGKRALKFRDWGKMAATFVDVESGRALRVVARESSRETARRMHPEIADGNKQQMAAYRTMPAPDLMATQWVQVELHPEDMPGYKAARIECDECGEGISFAREVQREGRTLCRACAGERYWKPA